MGEAKLGVLTLGPLLFNWSPEKYRDFYFRMAEAPVEIVYIGEVVCSKRAPFFEPVIPDVVERLTAAGKQVVHSTLGLIMVAREMQQIRDLVEGGPDYVVEANDISTVSLLAGRPHVIGPAVNVYNEGTLSWLIGQGATRVCLPGELPGESIAVLTAAAKGAEIEVQVFGRLPLANSARCYHARSRGLPKDNCLFACGDDPDGMELKTIDGEPFLTVNGTQTMSHSYCNLVAEMAEMRQAGVTHFRLSPHDTDMAAVARIYRDVLDGRLDVAGADARLAELVPDAPFSNGFYHGGEGSAFVGEQQKAAE
jgi:collagenase-like PrtC family protease